MNSLAAEGLLGVRFETTKYFEEAVESHLVQSGYSYTKKIFANHRVQFYIDWRVARDD